jgi:hypothetical protein
MADHYPASPPGDPRRQKSASGNVGASSRSDTTDIPPRTSTKRIGVYDRPERALGSWSPVTIIVEILGVLILLWLLGIFEYVLR